MHRKHYIALLVTAAFALLAGAPAANASSSLPGSWQKGFNFTSWTPGGYGSDAAHQSLQALADIGTNRVVLTPTWYMDTASSNDIAPDPAKSPSDDSIRDAMAHAKSLGMSVVLKPHVDVRDGTFRGDIAPESPAAWFASYRTMLTHYADLAREGEADTLVVGTELTSMATDTTRFEALIAAARSRFNGTLTYAANWIDEADSVGFWDRLDAIGIDAYMPLSTTGAPTVDSVAAAWTPYVQAITQLHARSGKPVMFTELGYQSRTDTLDHPASASGAPDPQIQAVAYAAALRVWSAVPWFQGIWWWNWEAEPVGVDPAGTFSIAGKPAAAVLRAAQGGTVSHPGVDSLGMTVPPGAGVLILFLVAGLALAVPYRRRRRAPSPQGPSSPVASPSSADSLLARGPALALVPPRGGLAVTAMSAPSTLAQPPAARPLRQPSLAPTAPALRQDWAGTVPPRLAAACTAAPTGLRPGAPTISHRPPSTHHGVAA